MAWRHPASDAGSPCSPRADTGFCAPADAYSRMVMNDFSCGPGRVGLRCCARGVNIEFAPRLRLVPVHDLGAPVRLQQSVATALDLRAQCVRLGTRLFPSPAHGRERFAHRDMTGRIETRRAGARGGPIRMALAQREA